MSPQEAINRGLHVGGFWTALGAPGFRRPRYVMADGSVVVRDSDCEPVRTEEVWDRERWDATVKDGGLWRRVGMWDFVPWDDPAADCIAFAHANPRSAGQELYELRQRVASVEGKE